MKRSPYPFMRFLSDAETDEMFDKPPAKPEQTFWQRLAITVAITALVSLIGVALLAAYMNSYAVTHTCHRECGFSGGRP